MGGRDLPLVDDVEGPAEVQGEAILYLTLLTCLRNVEACLSISHMIEPHVVARPSWRV